MKRKVLIFLSVVIFLGILGGLYLGQDLIVIGAGYRSKVLCSGIYVHGMSADRIHTENLVDVNPLMGFFTTTIDPTQKVVRTSLFGFHLRTAQWNGHECQLLPETRLTDRSTFKIDPNYPVSPIPLPIDLNERLNPILEKQFQDQVLRTRAILVVHRGKIVAEKYAGGIDARTRLPAWSISKSFVSALLGVLSNSGEIDMKAPLGLAGWGNDGRSEISFDDLIRMQSGLQFSDHSEALLANEAYMLFGTYDVGRFARQATLKSKPGVSWHYSSGDTNIICHHLKSVLGDRYHSAMTDLIFKPLGMTSARFEKDAAGTYVGSSFLHASTRDFARFGLLYLAKGQLFGTKFFDESWVEYTMNPMGIVPQEKYGAGFWLNGSENYPSDRFWPGLPQDTWMALGYEGQVIAGFPSRDLLVIRLGMTRKPKQWDRQGFLREVLDNLPSS